MTQRVFGRNYSIFCVVSREWRSCLIWSPEKNLLVVEADEAKAAKQPHFSLEPYRNVSAAQYWAYARVGLHHRTLGNCKHG